MMIRGVNLYTVVFACASVVASAETDVNFTVSQNATAVLEAHCLDCHDADTQKGEVRLDALGGMAMEARLDLLNRVQEQLFLKEMPPKKKAQPSEAERTALAKSTESPGRPKTACALGCWTYGPRGSGLV